MILTESEAKTKWCSYSGRVTTGDYDDVKPHPAARCLASGCMQWEWLGSNAPGDYGYCSRSSKPRSP